MKKIFRHAFYVILAVLVCGCELFADVFEPSYVMLQNQDQQTIRTGPEKSTLSVGIESNAEWTVTSNTDWCTPSPTDDGNLQIVVSENYTDLQRTAYITLTTEDSVGKLEITVIQRERNMVSVAEGDYHEIQMDGGLFEVVVQHNVEYDVSIPEEVTWIHEAETKALSTRKHVFSVDANATGQDREATILFVYLSSGISRRVTVLQYGKQPKRQFVFRVIHTNMSFKEPLMTGDFTGSVYWKHGQSTALGTYPEYTYSQTGEKDVIFDLFGQAEEFTVEFQSLEGIREIDFSGM